MLAHTGKPLASPVQGEVAKRSEVGGVVLLFNCAAPTGL